MKYTNSEKQVPHVAVVGAGIAGLTTAYRLAQQGIFVTVFEASDRVGGKVHTSQHKYAARSFENGAEFINSTDTSLLKAGKNASSSHLQIPSAHP